MPTKDLACGVILLGLAILYLLAAAALPTSALADAVGSAGFPMLIGWALAGASVLLILQSIGPRRRRESPTDTVDLGIWTDPLHAALRASGLAAIAVAFLLLLPILGYIVSLVLMIGAVVLYQGTPLSWRVVGVAIGGALFLWLLFVVTLDIPLPPGLWARPF